jgi:hypothetical protein
VIRSCVSNKIRLSRLAGLWVQLLGVKRGCGPGKGVEVETMPGGLILPEQGKIEEIRVELSLGPICFSKIRPCRPLDIPGPHIDNYQTPEVENPYSRYDIVEPLVANWLWVVVWLLPAVSMVGSDPKVPGA